MTDPKALADELLRLANAASVTDDNIAYYSGGSRRNRDAEDLARCVRHYLPTIIAALRAEPAKPVVDREAVALALVNRERADNGLDPCKFKDLSSPGRKHYLRKADAAIAAMEGE
jgi:hypothetical protein